MENFYIIGGENRPKSDALSDIVKYDPKSRVWSKSGQLSEGRVKPSVAISGSTIIVVGGFPSPYDGVPTETCQLNGDQFYCKSQDSYLLYYWSNPLLFAVADDYGKC